MKLTYEHVPPARVQALIPAGYLRFNPFDEALKSKSKLPPCTVAHGGLRVKSFCEACQQLTQTSYGSAFFEWSQIALEMCNKLTADEDRVQAVVQIEPLAVIKQIAAMALATSQFNNTKHLRDLREFVQHPERQGLPPHFDFFVYLNPLRPAYGLPQCRLIRKTSILTKFDTHEQAMILAEISVPPLGYVILYRLDGALDPSARQLMYLNHLSNVPPQKTELVALDIPVRTPFGPFPLRYMEDAANEPRRNEAPKSEP